MPGKQPREGEAPLTRAQSVIAAEILRREFDPAVNTQMAPDRKAVLLTMVNEAYLAKGLPPSYSLRKMEDWRANCVYRWKCRQQKKKPDCWGTDGRKRCRKAKKDKGAPPAAPGVSQPAIRKPVQAQAFRNHYVQEPQQLLGMPPVEPLPASNSYMMNTLMHINDANFTVPSPIMPHQPSAAVAYGSSSAPIGVGGLRLSPVPTGGAVQPEAAGNLTIRHAAGARDLSGAPGSGAPEVKLETVPQQKPSWIAQTEPAPTASEKTEEPAAPPSLASVLAPSTGKSPLADGETSVAVSPPSSIGDQSMRNPADFDGMFDKSAVKQESNATLKAPSPALQRNSLGSLASPGWSSWSTGGIGMSPWAPPGDNTAPKMAGDGTALSTMAAIEAAASKSMAPPAAVPVRSRPVSGCALCCSHVCVLCLAVTTIGVFVIAANDLRHQESVVQPTVV